MSARIVEQEEVLARHLHVDEVAVVARETGEERERIAARAVDESVRSDRGGPGHAAAVATRPPRASMVSPSTG